jgi:hypothetical protein
MNRWNRRLIELAALAIVAAPFPPRREVWFGTDANTVGEARLQ